MPVQNRIDTESALSHYHSCDSLLYERARAALQSSPRLEVPTPKHPDEYFPTLVRSIVSQQISTKAAASIYATLGRSYALVPQNMANVSQADLQTCGVTKQKAAYISRLAIAWDTLCVHDFPSLSNQEIYDVLIQQYGIGRWTVEMFLLFAMARPDIFSSGDLGLRQQIGRWYSVESTDIAAIEEIASSWAPYRSVATLTLWFYLDNGPVLL